MKLRFLGKGSAYYPPYGNTGAYALCGEELYLIDCGETAFEQLYVRLEHSTVSRIYVILTHLHADHVGSLGSLISYFYFVRHAEIFVVHPERTVVQLLDLTGIDREAYHYCEKLPDNSLGLKAKPVAVMHAKIMKCYGYVISDARESIYYSGDSCEVPGEVLGDFLAGKIARIYQDTATHESSSHCYYKKLEQKIPVSERGRVFCMHLDSPCEELLCGLGFSVVETEQV